MKVLNRLLFVGAAAVVASIVKKNMDRKNAEADLWATATDSAAPAAPSSTASTSSVAASEAGTSGASSPESAVDAAAGDAWGEATDRP